MLLSNNPFRRRAAPPNPALPNGATNNPSNPFLDSTDLTAPTLQRAPRPKTSSGEKPSANSGFDDDTSDLLADLGVDDKSPHREPPPLQTNGTGRRAENIPPRPFGKMPPPGHRPNPSDEERRRLGLKPRGPPGQLDIFADPPDANKHRERRPRHNSDTSVRDKPSKLLDPEEEKRRQDRRKREHRRPKQSSRKLDIIDKLDVTSIYGTGLFHHDGPFDACNPNRNRKGARAAPMQAFPKDSSNMSLGGSGPNNPRLNLDQIHGTGQEAHSEYNKSAVADEYVDDLHRPNPARSASFHPIAPVEPLHGEETAGLGTSTFLEGAPASRAAIERRMTEEESALAANANGGLGRKKSIVQKIRGVRPGGRNAGSPEPISDSPLSPVATSKSESNTSPFFKDYDNEYEKKSAAIATANAEEKESFSVGRSRAPSSPRRGLGLERKITTESVEGGDGDGKVGGGGGGGFLNRVKSLKGGRKARTERREASG